jgi:hypothetical protein
MYHIGSGARFAVRLGKLVDKRATVWTYRVSSRNMKIVSIVWFATVNLPTSEIPTPRTNPERLAILKAEKKKTAQKRWPFSSARFCVTVPLSVHQSSYRAGHYKYVSPRNNSRNDYESLREPEVWKKRLESIGEEIFEGCHASPVCTNSMCRKATSACKISELVFFYVERLLMKTVLGTSGRHKGTSIKPRKWF